MSWMDRMLDGDEGALHVQRSSAQLLVWLFLVFGALWVALLVASLVAGARGNDFDVPPSMLGTVAFLWVMTLFTQERYRRKKLEARVAALEGKAA